MQVLRSFKALKTKQLFFPVFSTKDVEAIIQKHLYIVEIDPILQMIFAKLPQVVFKRSNLRNMLVRADLCFSANIFFFLSNIPSETKSVEVVNNPILLTKTHILSIPVQENLLISEEQFLGRPLMLFICFAACVDPVMWVKLADNSNCGTSMCHLAA